MKKRKMDVKGEYRDGGRLGEEGRRKRAREVERGL
jgi:hypothetical protein